MFRAIGARGGCFLAVIATLALAEGRISAQTATGSAGPLARSCGAPPPPSAGGGPSGDQPAGGNDNVVDAEFEEVKDDKRKGS